MQRREWLGQLASQGAFFFRDCVPPLPLSSPSSSLIKWLNYPPNPYTPQLPGTPWRPASTGVGGVGESPVHSHALGKHTARQRGLGHPRSGSAIGQQKGPEASSLDPEQDSWRSSGSSLGMIKLRSGSHDVREPSNPCRQSFEFSLTRGVNIGHTLRQA